MMSGPPFLQSRAAAPTAHVVMKASELCRQGKFDSGIEFLKSFGGPEVQPAVHILLANRHLRDDRKWLHHLNQYLQQFGSLPLQLRGGPRKKFFRLHATPAKYVDEGPLVTVIMSAFNAEKTIETAARSILAQSWRQIELFIVDDLSTDKTLQIAQDLANKDPRVKILRNAANVGPYVSRNRVLGQCKGTYVTCHDADDWAFPDRIEMQVEEMRKADLGALVMRAVRMADDGEITGIGGQTSRSHDGVLQTSHVSSFFSREALAEKLGFWDSVRFGGDTEMIARASLALGSGAREEARPCLIYLDNPRSLTNDPVTGVKDNVMSPVRLEYRKHWKAWHGTIGADAAYLPFPAEERRFPAPIEMLVPADRIAACLG